MGRYNLEHDQEEILRNENFIGGCAMFYTRLAAEIAIPTVIWGEKGLIAGGLLVIGEIALGLYRTRSKNHS